MKNWHIYGLILLALAGVGAVYLVTKKRRKVVGEAPGDFGGVEGFIQCGGKLVNGKVVGGTLVPNEWDQVTCKPFAPDPTSLDIARDSFGNVIAQKNDWSKL